MRLKNVFPGVGLILLAAILLFWAGCSSNKTIVNNEPTDGSLTDPEFLLVKQQINNYLDSTMELLTGGFENIAHLPTDTDQVDIIHGPMGVNDTVTYQYIGGWHITYVSHYYQNFDFRFRDSVQFQKNSIAVPSADSADYMRYIHHWYISSNFINVTHTNSSGDVDIVYTNLDTDTATINGTNDMMIVWNFISNDSTLTATFDIDVTVDNIRTKKAMDGWISGCPCSGDINMTIAQSSILVVNDATTIRVRNWAIDISFNNGTATATITSDNEKWTYTYAVCSIGG